VLRVRIMTLIMNWRRKNRIKRRSVPIAPLRREKKRKKKFPQESEDCSTSRLTEETVF